MPADSIQSSRDSYLDSFDVPIRKFLEKTAREIGHDPNRLRPVILAAIENAKELVANEKPFPVLHYPVMRVRLREQAVALLIGVLGQSKKTRFASECIKSYLSVFVVGAGLSFESGMPLHKVLDQLLSFCEAEEYNELRCDEKKCFKFKMEFAMRCSHTNPSTSHELIAGNCGVYIREVICMNWDNLIEQAARKLKKDIPKVNEEGDVSAGSHIWKFHGDVEILKQDNVKGKGGWVFPDEQGYVFDCFLRYIEESRLREQMFTFVIVGYNEKEKEVYEKIIAPFEKIPRRTTFRVGLNLERLHEEYYLVGPADYVLEEILPAA